MIVCYQYKLISNERRYNIFLKPNDRFFGNLVGFEYTIGKQIFIPICGWKIKNNENDY